MRFKQTYNENALNLDMCSGKYVNSEVFEFSPELRKYVSEHSTPEFICSFSLRPSAMPLSALLKYVYQKIDIRFSEPIDIEEKDYLIFNDLSDEQTDTYQVTPEQRIKIEQKESPSFYRDIVFGLQLSTRYQELNHIIIQFLRTNQIIQNYPKLRTINNDLVWYWEKFKKEITSHRRYTYFTKQHFIPIKNETTPTDVYDLLNECIWLCIIRGIAFNDIIRCRDYSNQKEEFCVRRCWFREHHHFCPCGCDRENCITFNDLTSPPSEFAGNGRWNPKCISMFYGAFDLITAKAETGNPNFYVEGRFRTKNSKTLNILDLSSVPPFIDFWGENWAKYKFLDAFEKELSRPVSKETSDIEYIPTQALSEYIKFNSAYNVQGIMYRSAKIDRKKNVVLFFDQKSSSHYLELTDAYLHANGRRFDLRIN